jgi:hypothetical protein
LNELVVDDDDDEVETSRFHADELRKLVAGSSMEVDRPSTASASGIQILARPSRSLVMPDALRTPPPLTAAVQDSVPSSRPLAVAPVSLPAVDHHVPAPARVPAFHAAPSQPSPLSLQPRAVLRNALEPAVPAESDGFDWRESNLARKPAGFRFAHGLLKLLAIALGFAATTLCLMSLVGTFVDGLQIHAAVAAAIALVAPAFVAHALRPREDPLVAIGITSETYALVLLGFAVVFVIALHDRTASLLAAEGERAASAGVEPLARAESFLARGGLR